MKKILMIFVINALLLSDSSAAEDYSFKKDKQKHLAISALFAIGSETLLEAYNKHSLDKTNRLNGVELISYSTLIALVPGVIKESMDANEANNEWSNADIAYDFAGSLIGSSVSYSLHRLFDDDNYRVYLSLHRFKQQLFISYNF